MKAGRTPQEEAELAYQRAVERVEVLVAEWERLGQPPKAEGGSTGRALVPHPLIGAIQEAESLANRLRQPLLMRHRGPEPKAVMQPSPAVKLRARNSADAAA